MQWLIQNSGLTFDALDHNLTPLVKSLDESNIPKFSIGYIPFTNILTGLENINSSIPTIFYGSTRVAELAKYFNFKPGSFYNKLWFDPKQWIGKRDDLLNEKQTRVSVFELRTNWIGQSSFIKSVDPKILTGMVLEESDQDWWTKEYSHIDGRKILTISPLKNIVQEWRFFIIDGKLITGSQYKHDGILRIKEPIHDEVWCKAIEMSKKWLPSKNIVMDICKLNTGEFNVVEFNSFNSSGFYNCDVKKIVQTFEKIYK